MSQRPTSPQSLWARITVSETGCWEMSGYRDRQGYAKVKFHGSTWPAHRVTYTLMRGAIPAGAHIDHLCRNTGCVNPDHLEPVTQLENNRRTRREVCGFGHLFTPENTMKCGASRVCRACRNRQKRESYHRLRSSLATSVHDGVFG
jgi:hypothetical protein